MRRRCRLWNVGIGCLAGAGVATAIGLGHRFLSAHYSERDPITVRGSVTKVEWTNPHTYFYLDVEDDNDEVQSWAFEMGSPVVLQRFGWSPRSLEVGDLVEVDGYLIDDGDRRAHTASVLVLGTGERLQATAN